jgi:hypothetical protein
MLLMNETLSLFSVQLLVIDNERMRCLVSMQSRLENHFTVVSIIQMLFASIYIALLTVPMFLLIFSSRFRYIYHIIKSNIRLRSYSPLQRYSYIAVVLVKEVLLMFVYILFCCIYQWYGLSNNATHVTWIQIRRWFVEATCVPYLCFCFLIEYSVGRPNIIFDEHQSYYIAVILVKLPVFFVMRFAESQSGFFLNRFELFLLQKKCEFLVR